MIDLKNIIPKKNQEIINYIKNDLFSKIEVPQNNQKIFTGGSLSNIIFNIYHNNPVDLSGKDFDFVISIPEEETHYSIYLINNDIAIGHTSHDLKTNINTTFISNYNIKKIINGYDINSVYCYYDFEKDAIFCKKEFLDFLFKKKLYIVREDLINLNTLNRLYDKSKEFRLDGNIDHYIDIFSENLKPFNKLKYTRSNVINKKDFYLKNRYFLKEKHKNILNNKKIKDLIKKGIINV